MKKSFLFLFGLIFLIINSIFVLGTENCDDSCDDDCETLSLAGVDFKVNHIMNPAYIYTDVRIFGYAREPYSSGAAHVYEWYINDEFIGSPWHIDYFQFKKNDYVKLKMYLYKMIPDPEDPEDLTKRTKVCSEKEYTTRRISNSDPVITGISVGPAHPSNSDDITFYVSVTDKDDDDIRMQYKFSGGYSQSYGPWVACSRKDSCTVTLPSSKTNLGDRITFEVYVNDYQYGGDSNKMSRTVTVNEAPVITDFSPSGLTMNKKVGDVVDFSVTATDAESQRLTYRWYVDDVYKAAGTSYSYTVEADTSHVVKVTVTDTINGKAEKQWTVNVNQEPTVTISSPANNAQFDVDETISFNGNIVDDGTIIAYVWSFGDGEVSTLSQNPTHAYSAEGTYTVKFKVLDSFNEWSNEAQINIVVGTPNEAPTATLTASPTSGDAPLAVSFTLEATDDDLISSWTLDIDNDGAADYSGTDDLEAAAETQAHTYLTAGTYIAKLIVTDNEGATDFDTITITANTPAGPPNTPPTADITSPSDGAEFNTGVDIDFQGTGTDTEDGTVSDFLWNFGDEQTSTSQNPTHSYSAEGDYTVTLTVTDSAGATDSATITLDINTPAGPPNTPPTADITSPSDADEFDVEANVNFEGTGTDPEDGTVSDFLWNFGDEQTSTSQNPTHSYSAEGDYTVTLTVTDSEGAADSDSITISLVTPTVPNTAPTLSALSDQPMDEDDPDGINNAIDLESKANDDDGHDLTFSIISQSNTGLVTASIDSSNYLDIGAPAANQHGTSTVCVVADDGQDTSDQQCFDIIVDPVNDAPVISSQSPSFANPKTKTSQSVTFSILSSDVEGDQLGTNWYVNDAEQIETSNSFSYSNTQEGDYTITVKVSDGTDTSEHSWTLTISGTPVADTFDMKTDLSTITDFSNVPNFFLGKTGKGKIQFTENLDLTDVIDLDNNVLIANGLIGINTAAYSQLNKKATLTMYGLSFSETPKVYYSSAFTSTADDVTTLCDFCTVKSYSNGVLEFDVDHFTTFRAALNVTPPAPPVTQSDLTFSDFDVEVDDDKDKNLENGEKISKDAKPGSVVKLNIEVRNNYDFDLKDVRVEATLSNIGEDNDKIEEESDEFDLDDGDKEEITLEFDIPLKVEDKEYTFTIEVFGEDNNNTRYSTEWTIYLEVKKDKHKVVINEADLNPFTVRCENKAILDVEITNIGRNDEDEVVITVRSEELGLSLKETDIKLDEDIDDDDNDYKKTFTFSLPSDLAEDTYPIQIKVEYDDGDKTETKTVNLVKETCKKVVEPVEVVTPFVKPAIPEIPPKPVSFEYILFLIAVGCVVLGLIAFGIGYLTLKRR